jgi:methionyl-tRNA formyltransferase
MRIVFMGTPEFAVVSLKKLQAEGFDLVGVVTVPDKPKGRGQKMHSSPVKLAALEMGLPVLQPVKLKAPEFLNDLQALKPDLIVVVAFRILPAEVFTLPQKGTINLHGSLLPAYRGAAPINWAVINGDAETGATTFFIQEKVDTGNMIDQVRIPVGENMTAGEVHDRMAVEGAVLLAETCRRIKAGNVTPKVQDESLVSKAPKIFREDCRIDFNRPAREVHNFIRGLSPYPAPHCRKNGLQFKLFGSRVINETVRDEIPGTITEIPGNAELHIQCNTGQISISEIQMEGKRRMSVAEYLRGYKISVGERFE